MVMLKNYTAYFDASGHPDEMPGAVFVTGFVSTIDKWLLFEAEWLALLDRHGIEPPFHMSEFATGQPPFEEWEGDLKRQTAFHVEVRQLLKKRMNKSFGQGVLTADLERVRREYELPTAATPPRETIGVTLADAYTYCAVGAFLLAQDWKDKRMLPGERIEYVYETGDEHQPHFAHAMRELFGVDPIFRKKEESVPLQAADYLAWEHRKVLMEQIQNSSRPTRKSLRENFIHLPGGEEWRYSTWLMLASLCDEQGYPKRGVSQ